MSNYQSTSSVPIKENSEFQNPNLQPATTYPPIQGQPVYYSQQPNMMPQQGTYQAHQPFYNAQPVVYTQPMQPPQPSIQTQTTSAYATLLDEKKVDDQWNNLRFYLQFVE